MTPNRPFFESHADRVLLARRRYFDDGVLPTGVVSEAVFQSWARCLRARWKPHQPVAFQPVSASRAQLALQRNQALHEAWLSEVPTMGSAFGATNCSVILTDATGVVIGATPTQRSDLSIMPVAHRVGVNLSEELVGTTAPGLVARTGKQASVMGAEHFSDGVSGMFCSAAPIRNSQGQLAGILDISCEGSPFHFNPASVVGLYAASIENRLLLAQVGKNIIVKLQFMPAMLDTPMAGIMGFREDGELSFINSVASTLLNISPEPTERGLMRVENIFEFQVAQLLAQANQGCQPMRLAGGLHVYVQVMAPCERPVSVLAQPVSSKPIVNVPPPCASNTAANVGLPALDGYLPPSSLKDADVDLIKMCLMECKGNISRAARKLKVSRGLIYRRLQELSIDPAQFKA